MIATKRLRAVMTHANREAQAMNHEFIGTEHLLLGLTAEGGVGCGVLRGLGVDPGDARREVLRLVRPGPDMITLGTLPQTPRAKNCIEYAIAEAGRAGRDTGTGELLLGLLREDEGVAAHILMRLGALRGRTLDDVRRAVDAETLRAGDDAPPDTLRSGADVSAGFTPSPWAAALRFVLFVLGLSVCLACLVAAAIWPIIGSAALRPFWLILGSGVVAAVFAGNAAYIAQDQRGRLRRAAAALVGPSSVNETWDGSALAAKRRDLTDAIAAKFGPLDEARREAIQKYDQGRIAETARRLPGAAKIEDLDGDTT